jgi:hypothetical protein
MRATLLPCLFLVVTSCVVPEVQYTATVTTPDLVEVSPGVRVIADYDEPIFFADGFYWWFYGDTWYRSTTYTGGWIWIASPPLVIAQIRTPHVYRHYRPMHWTSRHRPVPAHRVQRPRVRDHRHR